MYASTNLIAWARSFPSIGDETHRVGGGGRCEYKRAKSNYVCLPLCNHLIQHCHDTVLVVWFPCWQIAKLSLHARDQTTFYSLPRFRCGFDMDEGQDICIVDNGA